MSINKLNEIASQAISKLDIIIAQTDALGSAVVLMEADIKQQYRELAEYKKLGMTEAVSVKRGMIARAKKNLETIRAMWEAMR